MLWVLFTLSKGETLALLGVLKSFWIILATSKGLISRYHFIDGVFVVSLNKSHVVVFKVVVLACFLFKLAANKVLWVTVVAVAIKSIIFVYTLVCFAAPVLLVFVCRWEKLLIANVAATVLTGWLFTSGAIFHYMLLWTIHHQVFTQFVFLVFGRSHISLHDLNWDDFFRK